MSTRPPRAALSLGLAATVAAACGGDAGTGVTLEIASDPQAPPATHLMLDWFDGQRALFRGRRVPPGAGPLPAGEPITVRIETATAMRGAIRRALVRGMSAGGQVSEGAGTVVLGSGGWRTMTVKLVAGRLPDRDLDGVPDAIDGCPDDEARTAGCQDPPASTAPDASAGVSDAATTIDTSRDGDQPGGGDLSTADAGAAPDAGGGDGPLPSPDRGTPDVVGPPAADAATTPPRDSQPPPPDLAPDVAADGPRPIQCAMVMIVVSGPNERGDLLMAERLKEMGCQVTARDDDALATGDATGKALVIISDSVLPAKVMTKLRAVSVPVINMEPLLLDDMALTGPAEGTDWDRNLSHTQLTILDAGHAMAAGLNGMVTLFSEADPIGWGKPDAAAIRIAAVPGNIGQLVIFGYETGASMVPATFTAPARRVALNLNETAFAKLQAPGWALFDAAVRWALRAQ